MELKFDPTKKFRISTDVIDRLPAIAKDSKIDLDGIHSCVNVNLQRILMPEDGIIDGELLKSSIFPSGFCSAINIPEFDVFISHSHNDKDKAVKFADYLYSVYNVVPFIDNFVWGSADDLLKKIDNEYCKNEDNGNYNYNKRNFSTSHVHSMLSMAILEMIASCKSFIFIESDESVDFNQLKQSGTKTLSPWLYQELRYAKMLSSAMRLDVLLENRTFSAGGTLRISYDADLRDFNIITLPGLYRGDYSFS